MDYLKFEFQTNPENNEMLIALLGELPFESFEENDQGLNAYIQVKNETPEVDERVLELKDLFEFSHQKIVIKYQNWNAVWESNFDTIVVRDFCGIRADFHKPLTEVKHEIVINPKMAFGTGHHETTWMMMSIMESLDFIGKNVFDYGCGTGILAILASQLGAKKIDAIDIELPSYENTLENARINNIENIKSIHGTLEKVDDQMYDIILANINRHVILDSFSTLNKMLTPNGILLISGILKEDEELVKNAAKSNNFKIEKTEYRNNWICVKLTVNVER
ncbi:MAG: 50S ribosomal protein L11 methyltransferase [Saprospiraceae bacterium]